MLSPPQAAYTFAAAAGTPARPCTRSSGAPWRWRGGLKWYRPFKNTARHRPTTGLHRHDGVLAAQPHPFYWRAHHRSGMSDVQQSKKSGKKPTPLIIHTDCDASGCAAARPRGHRRPRRDQGLHQLTRYVCCSNLQPVIAIPISCRCPVVCCTDHCRRNDAAQVPNQHGGVWDLWIGGQLDPGMPIHCLCHMGQLSTPALQAAGTKGRRYSMPNARIMLRQAMGGAQGSAFEVTITATELNHTNQARFYLAW